MDEQTVKLLTARARSSIAEVEHQVLRDQQLWESINVSQDAMHFQTGVICGAHLMADTLMNAVEVIFREELA